MVFLIINFILIISIQGKGLIEYILFFVILFITKDLLKYAQVFFFQEILFILQQDYYFRNNA
jgi:hypothetical protein